MWIYEWHHLAGIVRNPCGTRAESMYICGRSHDRGFEDAYTALQYNGVMHQSVLVGLIYRYVNIREMRGSSISIHSRRVRIMICTPIFGVHVCL